MSEIPDFEPTVPPVNEYPAPKKPRKKPTKRRKAAPVDRSAAIRFGKAKAKKARKVSKRRGRPVGSLGKPKLVVDTSTVATIIGIHAQIEHALSQLSPIERKDMLELFE